MRELFKTYELFGEHATVAGRERALEIARDVARAPVSIRTSTSASTSRATSRSSTGRSCCVVYAKGPARPLAEVSFLLARLAGEMLERVRLVFAPELREAITAAIEGDAPSR